MILRKYLLLGGFVLLASGLIDIYFWCYGLPSLPAQSYLIPSWTLGAFSFAMGVTLILTLCTYTKEKKEVVK